MILHCDRWRLLVGVIVLIGGGKVCSGAVLSIGHRGDSLHAPENTVAAFVACSNKADLVEVDVRVSKDGVLVAMHDATVDRTTDGSGTVSALTLAQLKALDAGSKFSTNFAGERIPTLEETVTNTVPFARPLIEHKAGSAAAYLAELQRLDAVTNVVVQSFDWDFLAALHELEPAVSLCALGSSTLTAALLTNALNAGASTVAWEQSKITAAEVSLVHSMGLKLFVWTVNGPAINTFIGLGVDGIISDDPGAVRNYQQPATNGPVSLPDGLIAYWRMDDGLTNAMAVSVTDSEGTNTATLVRGDELSHWQGVESAVFGGCLQPDGLNASVLIPRTDSLDIGTNGLTISLWVKLTRLPSKLATSFGAVFDSTNDAYVVYLDKGNKELRFKVTDVNNHAARPGIPESALQTNQWLHVVATYSGQASLAGGETWIYLDGEAKDAHYGSDSSSPNGLTGNVKPGQFAAMGREGHTGGSYFSGQVDDVAIWNRALNATEVATLHQSGQTGLSLGDLLRQPTSLIRLRAIQVVGGNQVAITFQNMGTWGSFRLLRATSLAGPFLPVYGLTPADLTRGMYRFDCPLGSGSAGYFRVEAY
ncbi:MAG TPA: glycerophosphodiester phosphodiesterase family protein [Verrucomicrobiota bacterium]|nr:glycerophosphodiester phosphodiesterase family protein [Verrucomicrobiota bacterium]